tara:strand:- start:116810 stop:117844 length:1035 start_codon:yes stop_codon:yes gene_type:complete
MRDIHPPGAGKMKHFRTIFLLAAIVAIAVGLWFWWQHEKVYPSTEDAYLQAHVLTISPQIGGRVASVAVTENQHVNAGDVLFQINTDDLKAALEAAQAQYEIAREIAGASVSSLSGAEAQLDSARAALTEAQVEFDRTSKLRKLGDVSQSAMDKVSAERDQAQAAVEAAQSAADAARDRAGTRGDGNATVRAALADLRVARLNLERSRVTAPASGWVANIDLRPGSLVTPNAPLFSLVEDGDWWIDANFKETDLNRVRPGQPVKIAIGMYPGLSLSGKVESIGAGSGAAFSLLPAQNATGNWVKVTQRFPVRVHLESRPEDPAMQLRVGASTTVTVDTSSMDAK